MFDSLKERFENIFSSLRGKGKLSEEDINLALREVRRALLEADVNYKVVKDVVEAIRARATGQQVLESITPSQIIFTIVYEELIKIMGEAPAPLVISPKPPDRPRNLSGRPFITRALPELIVRSTTGLPPGNTQHETMEIHAVLRHDDAGRDCGNAGVRI